MTPEDNILFFSLKVKPSFEVLFLKTTPWLSLDKFQEVSGNNWQEVHYKNLLYGSDYFVYALYTTARTLTKANMNLNYAVEQA